MKNRSAFYLFPRCKSDQVYTAIEGEVLDVVVKNCYDLSKLLREITPKDKALPNVQTLAFWDETSIPPGQNERMQVQEEAQEEVFPRQKILSKIISHACSF